MGNGSLEQIQELEEQLKEAREVAHLLFAQVCAADIGEQRKYDHMGLYEYEQTKLIEWGLIKPEECVRK
jgi:hypothetical protein